MRAKLFTVLLSLFVVSLPIQAALIHPSQSKINLNKADAQTLVHSVSGIGEKKAESIVAYRETHGNFKTIDDLAQVRGLSKQFIKKHLSELQTVFVIN